MVTKRYTIPESENVPSDEFNKHYSSSFENCGIFVYDIQNAAIILEDRRYQTFPSNTYKGNLIFIGTDKNNEAALLEIKSKGFSLEEISKE